MTITNHLDDHDRLIHLLLQGADVPSYIEDRPEWMSFGACNGHDPNLWFPSTGEHAAEASAICERCTVRDECLDYALSDPSLVGVWAGTSLKTRRRLRAGRAA